MSDSIRSERDRKIAELEALVAGQATMIDDLFQRLEQRERQLAKCMTLANSLRRDLREMGGRVDALEK